MLILSRNVNEAVTFDGPGKVVVCKIEGGRVALGFIADKSTKIMRCEIESKEADK